MPCPSAAANRRRSTARAAVATMALLSLLQQLPRAPHRRGARWSWPSSSCCSAARCPFKLLSAASALRPGPPPSRRASAAATRRVPTLGTASSPLPLLARAPRSSRLPSLRRLLPAPQGGLPRSPRSSLCSPAASATRLLSVAPRIDDADSGLRPSDAVGGRDDHDGKSRARLLTLSTATLAELEGLVTGLGHPKYRAAQIRKWVWDRGVTDADEMVNLPKALREQLLASTRPCRLVVAAEQVSAKDGTVKRAYRCEDGQVIESVLMRYGDGRCTACISSQAGCAQRCSFCATGHMGFSRQLSSDEILEQVYHFSALLRRQEQQQSEEEPTAPSTSARPGHRLSNVVFMGMGEPLANYRNVNAAVRRIVGDAGIGARRITVSTVGIVPNIRKMMEDPSFPPVKLAVSLHAASDPARSAMIPANDRYGGLDALMATLREYVDTTSRRITLEWALIDQVNDLPSVARELGRLVQHHGIRRDMVHVNVIPLNPTDGYAGSPSQRKRVDAFCDVLGQEFGIACTPRVRRGIDIDAGCGQLKSSVLRKDGEAES